MTSFNEFHWIWFSVFIIKTAIISALIVYAKWISKGNIAWLYHFFCIQKPQPEIKNADFQKECVVGWLMLSEFYWISNGFNLAMERSERQTNWFEAGFIKLFNWTRKLYENNFWLVEVGFSLNSNSIYGNNCLVHLRHTWSEQFSNLFAANSISCVQSLRSIKWAVGSDSIRV